MSLLAIHKALADESRLRIVHILQHGYFNVQELTQVLELGQSTISHHLKTLQGAGLTKMHKEGTWAYYTLCSSEESSQVALTLKALLTATSEFPTDTISALTETDHAEVKKILNKRRDRSHRFFEEVAGKWKELREEAQGSESFLDDIVALIPQKARLLELGCGSGAFLEKILPREGTTIGVDYSQAMLDEARQNLGGLAEKIDLRLGYLEHLPLGDESVDVAVAYMVLHHVPNPKEALLDAQRTLTAGGTLYVVDLMAHTNEYMQERYADLWLGFKPEEMSRWAREAGFSNATLEPLGQSKQSFLLTCTK